MLGFGDRDGVDEKYGLSPLRTLTIPRRMGGEGTPPFMCLSSCELFTIFCFRGVVGGVELLITGPAEGRDGMGKDRSVCGNVPPYRCM